MDFRDCRSMKVVLVAHCALNQNSRLATCAELPAGVEELAAEVRDQGLKTEMAGMIDSDPQAALEIVDRWDGGGA